MTYLISFSIILFDLLSCMSLHHRNYTRLYTTTKKLWSNNTAFLLPCGKEREGLSYDLT